MIANMPMEGILSLYLPMMKRTKFPSPERSISDFPEEKSSTDPYMAVSYSYEEEPIILSKGLVDLFLRQENPADLIALYIFYYYTAKWQRTNQPKATTDYAAKSLGWSGDRVRKIKKRLISLGLIKNVVKKDPESNKIVGYYIHLNFIWRRANSENFIPESKQNNSSLSESHRQDNRQGYSSLSEIQTQANRQPNALNTNNNALNTNNAFVNFPKIQSIFPEGVMSDQLIHERHITPSKFDDFWKLYPKKAKKPEAKAAWEKICKKKSNERPTFEMIEKAILNQKTSKQWQDKQFIPMPSTWLNGSKWLISVEEMDASIDALIKIRASQSANTTGSRRFGKKVDYRKPIITKY
jgi:hypothetical protein